MIAAAALVIVGPLARRQPRQLRGAQPRRLGLVVDEAAPALLRGQRVIGTHVVLGVGVGARPAVGGAAGVEIDGADSDERVVPTLQRRQPVPDHGQRLGRVREVGLLEHAAKAASAPAPTSSPRRDKPGSKRAPVASLLPTGAINL